MWDNDLAREFKKGDNPPTIGACIGEIKSVNPLLATIYEGQITIDESNGYICGRLLDFESECSLTGTGSLNGSSSVSGSGSIDGTGSFNGSTEGDFSASGTISVNGSGSVSGTFESEGKITNKAILKAGDMVLVIPSGDEQSFFIVDIIKGVE